jgi:hypothetical protein
MAFLEKEEAPPSAFWDWVIGIGLVVLIGGFTLFYQYQKRSSGQGFNQADSLFHAGQFKRAATAYEELKNAQYLSTHHDSLIYSRLDSIEALKEQEEEGAHRIKALLSAGDTSAAKQTFGTLSLHGLADSTVTLYLDSVKELLKP